MSDLPSDCSLMVGDFIENTPQYFQHWAPHWELDPPLLQKFVVVFFRPTAFECFYILELRAFSHLQTNWESYWCKNELPGVYSVAAPFGCYRCKGGQYVDLHVNILLALQATQLCVTCICEKRFNVECHHVIIVLESSNGTCNEKDLKMLSLISEYTNSNRY